MKDNKTEKKPGNVKATETGSQTGKKPDQARHIGTAAQARKKKKRYRRILVALIAILAVFLVVLIGVFAIFRHYYKLSNYVKDSDTIDIDEDILASLDEEEDIDDALKELTDDLDGDVDAAKKALMEKYGVSFSDNDSDPTQISDNGETVADSVANNSTISANGNVYNVLLIGADRRDASWMGNSDAMVLISINYDKKAIYMTSFMRDLYVNIPGVGYRKMNHSCAVGGPALVVQTLQNNFLIPVNNYAYCDFNGLMNLVDAIGGIDVNMTDQEAIDEGFSGGGVIHLKGPQALFYARNRSSGGGSDYRRTERQRTVLMAIYNKIKSGSLGDINSAANAILPYVTHNIDATTLASLISQAPTLLNYPITQMRVPVDGMYSTSGEYLVPDYNATIQYLYSAIY